MRCKFLNLCVKGLAFAPSAFGFMLFSVLIFLPKLPFLPLSHPIFCGHSETWVVIGVQAALEFYVFPTCMGALFNNTVLIFVTYLNVAGCFNILNEELQQTNKDFRKIEAVSIYYQQLQTLAGRLNSGFSACLLCQELGILFATILFIYGSSIIVVDGFSAISLSFKLNGVQVFFCLVIQFYPMILLNLNSRKIVRWARGRKHDSKYLQALMARHQELKIRPMGVHTVTLNTLSDYVTTVVSFILMLHEV